MGVSYRKILLSLLLLALSVTALAGEAQEFAVSQVSARLPGITAYLDILDATGQPVNGIGAADLSATVGQETVSIADLKAFEESGEGVAYVFLIDVSKSEMPAQFAQMRDALKAWVADLKDKDRAAILAFGDDARLVTDFTANKQELNSKLDQLRPSDNQTALHAALMRAMDMARRQDEGLTTRRVIVVLTDGKDEGSGITVEDVLEKTRQTHLPIYAIGYSGLPGSERQKYLDVLHRFARSSGGVYREAGTAPFAQLYADIRKAVRRVFVATLLCNACKADGQVQRLQVHLNKNGRAMNDGLDLLLIPDARPQAATQRPAAEIPPVWWKRVPWWGYAVAGLLAAIGLTVIPLAIRNHRRKARAQAMSSAIDGNAQGGFSSGVRDEGLTIRLTVMRGQDAGYYFDLHLDDRATIGRGQGCDVMLETDEELSSRHCELVLMNGRLMISDLQSTNGTLVNGVPVNGLCRIESGDTIAVGQTDLRVTFEEN